MVKRFMCVRVLEGDCETYTPTHVRVVAEIDYDALASDRDRLLCVANHLDDELRGYTARLAEALDMLRIVRNTTIPHSVRYDIDKFLGAADSAPDVACNWREDNEGVWFADCGLAWCLEYEPLPSKHEMAHCPKCGKPLVEHPYVEPPVCGECGEELEDGKCPEGCNAETVSAAANVGCEREDGLLNIHPESETCEVCRAADPTEPVT